MGVGVGVGEGKGEGVGGRSIVNLTDPGPVHHSSIIVWDDNEYCCLHECLGSFSL